MRLPAISARLRTIQAPFSSCTPAIATPRCGAIVAASPAPKVCVLTTARSTTRSGVSSGFEGLLDLTGSFAGRAWSGASRRCAASRWALEKTLGHSGQANGLSATHHRYREPDGKGTEAESELETAGRERM